MQLSTICQKQKKISVGGVNEELPIDDTFPNEQLMAIPKWTTPWYADTVNQLLCGILPPDLNFHQRKKFLYDRKS